MRVQYTLPGFLPAETVSAEPLEPLGGPFFGRLKVLPLPRGLNWKSLLRLDEDPSNATSIGPPPRPTTLEFRDASSERWDWLQMLNRLAATSGLQSDQLDSSGPEHAIPQMLALLLHFGEAEDSIAARHLAESEG